LVKNTSTYKKELKLKYHKIIKINNKNKINNKHLNLLVKDQEK